MRAEALDGENRYPEKWRRRLEQFYERKNKEHGKRYKDAVLVISSSSSTKNTRDAAKAKLNALARDVLDLTDQEAVFIAVGGDAEII